MIKYKDMVKSKLEKIQVECAEKDRIKEELVKKLREKEHAIMLLNSDLEELKKQTTHAYMTAQVTAQIRELQEENKGLKQVEHVNKEQIMQLQSNLNMLQDELKGAEEGQVALGRQNSKLLVANNPQAKTTYLDKQRNEMTQLKKDNIRFQDEAKSAR